MYVIDEIRNSFICGDAVDELRNFPNGSIDLAVTSPPYNLKNSTGNGMKDGRGGKWSNAALINGYSTYDDNMPYGEYVLWQRACLSEMMRVVNDNGAIFYNTQVACAGRSDTGQARDSGWFSCQADHNMAEKGRHQL